MKDINKVKKFNKLAKVALKNLNKDTFLYINYPFCLNHCKFCIYKIHKYSKIDSDKFLKLYNREILLYAKKLNGFKFKNIHIGGGTPNLISPKLLIEPLNNIVDFNNIERFVVEVFPRDDLSEYIKELKKYNITKIQLGVQTLNEKILRSENRIVSTKTIINCMKVLSKSNFIWSVDLIYGFNKEDSYQRDYIRELETILSFTPLGIHLYNIRYEKGNRFYMRENIKKDDSRHIGRFGCYSDVVNILIKNGYKKVYDEWCIKSNKRHALKTVCVNNKTGVFPDIIGLGVGARSITRLVRYINTSSLKDYIFLLNKDLFPVNDYSYFPENNLYPINMMALVIGVYKEFNIKKFKNSLELSKEEEKEFVLLFSYLKNNGIKINLNNGKLIIPDSQYSKSLFLIEKYILSRGGWIPKRFGV